MTSTSFDTSTFKDLLANGTAWQPPCTFDRLTNLPLDKSSVFFTYNEASAYVAEQPNAYPGQFLAVVEDDKTTGYIVGQDGALMPIGVTTGEGGLEELWNALKKETAERLSSEAKLSSDLTEAMESLSSEVNKEIAALEGKHDSETSFLSGKIDIINGPVTQEGSIKYNVKDAVDHILCGAPEMYDTLKEIADYISSDLSAAANMTAHFTRLDNQVETLSNNLGTLTNNFNTLTGTTLPNTFEEIYLSSTAISTVVATLNGDVETEGSVKKQIKDAVDGINGDTSELCAALSAAIKNEVERAEQAESDLQDAIDDEKERAEAVESELSNAIDNKIKVDGKNVKTLNVQHVSQDEYHELTLGNSVGNLTYDDNTVYIVSSDNFNMYGYKVINLADGVDDTDAVNVKQLNALKETLNGDVDKLSAEIFTPETGLKDVLLSAIKNENKTMVETVGTVSSDVMTNVSTVSADVMKNLATVSADLQDTVEAVSADLVELVGEVSAETLTSANAYADSKFEDLKKKVGEDYVLKSDVVALTSDIDLEDQVLTAINNIWRGNLITAYVDSKLTDTTADLTAEYPVGPGKTFNYVNQENGRLTAEVVDIQIDESQVTDLTSDLAKLADDISFLSDDYVKNTTFTTWKSDLGLDAADDHLKEDDYQVVFKKDIKSLEKAMHFVGVKDKVPEELTAFNPGDIIIVGTKEYVFDPGDPTSDPVREAAFVELGDENLYVSGPEWENWLTGTYNTFKKETNDKIVFLSGEIDKTNDKLDEEVSFLSGVCVALSSEIDELSANLGDDLEDLSVELYEQIQSETERATAAENGLSGAVKSLSTYTGNLSVRINEVTTTFVDSVADFQISCIYAGGAALA